VLYALCVGGLNPLAQGFRGSTPENFFSLGNMSHFCIIFRVASIFVSIVGRFFAT
jgi:hypothetical protein